MTRIIAPVEFIINVLDAPSGFDFDELYLLFDYFYIETELRNEFDIKATVHSHETQAVIELAEEGDTPNPVLLVEVEFDLDVPDGFDYDDLHLHFDYDHVALAIRNLFDIEAAFETHETQCPYEPEEDSPDQSGGIEGL